VTLKLTDPPAAMVPLQKALNPTGCVTPLTVNTSLPMLLIVNVRVAHCPSKRVPKSRSPLRSMMRVGTNTAVVKFQYIELSSFA
jgi:hypothetical protein